MNALIEQGSAEHEGRAEGARFLAAGWPHTLVRGEMPAIQGETRCTQRGCPGNRDTLSGLQR